MPINRNTLLRIRTIDACLRRRQRLWTLEDLRRACEDALFDMEGIGSISTRTIQRDIELMRGDKLGYWAPIVVKDRKYYTYDDPDYSITQLPLSKHDLEELSSAMDIIKHYEGFKGMAGQEDILARMQDQIATQTDHRQVVFIETNKRLKGLQFLSPLYEFIRREQPVIMTYQSFHSRKPHDFRLSPYVLTEFNNRWFLLAHNKRMHDIQTLALDRIIKVESDEQGHYIPNTFFNPDTYLGEMVGVTRSVNTSTEKVTLWVDAYQAPYVLTKPLHSSQQLTSRHADGSIIVSLDVIVNLELQRLILGYGCHMEVIAPRVLRYHIAQSILMAAARYQK